MSDQDSKILLELGEYLILFENLFKLRQRCLAVGMVTAFVSLIYNLKTVF